VVFCEVEGVGMGDAGNDEGMFGYKDGTLTIAIGVTVSGLAKVAIFTTNVHTKHECSNLRKTVIRSTEPPLLPNPCYRLPFFRSCISSNVFS
jgi:hypothetical protein